MADRKHAALEHTSSSLPYEVHESELAAMAIPRPPLLPQEMAATPSRRPRVQSGVRWVAAERRAQKAAERLEAITEGPPRPDEA